MAAERARGGGRASLPPPPAAHRAARVTVVLECFVAAAAADADGARAVVARLHEWGRELAKLHRQLRAPSERLHVRAATLDAVVSRLPQPVTLALTGGVFGASAVELHAPADARDAVHETVYRTPLSDALLAQFAHVRWADLHTCYEVVVRGDTACERVPVASFLHQYARETLFPLPPPPPSDGGADAAFCELDTAAAARLRLAFVARVLEPLERAADGTRCEYVCEPWTHERLLAALPPAPARPDAKPDVSFFLTLDAVVFTPT